MTAQTIVVFAAGSRGDIQPCVALGQGLTGRGHRVRMIAAERYRGLVEAAGLELAPLTADPAEILQSDEGQQLLAGGRNPIRFLTGFKRILGPMAERLLGEIQAACEGADLLLFPSAGALGEHLSESLDVPWAVVHFQPSHPTGAFPHPMLPQGLRLGNWGNRRTFEAVDQVAWQLGRPFINRWRKEALGLAGLSPRGPMRQVRRARRTVLCCFSEAVVPRPADWPSYVHMTGYWFLREPHFEPPADLVKFLEAGPPPVYVGFGSMIPSDPALTDRLVRQALRRAGVRGVLQGDPATSEHDMHVVGDIAHSWLFPRMAAVVHHGGAGTTSAGLRAGVPTVVCPFFGDQPYWGERVHGLGAGPRPVPFKRLNVERLAKAVREAVEDPAVTKAAAEAGRRIRAEDGVANACELLLGPGR